MRKVSMNTYGYDPVSPYWINRPSTQSVSVGIYRYVPKASGKGQKLESAHIRVKGPVSNLAGIYADADAICDALNAGRTSAPSKQQTVTAARVIKAES